MARWNTLRSPVGAAALAAIAIAGCGAAANKPSHRLHAAAEKSLLTLVARARTDVSARDGAQAHIVLADFVTEVGTLRRSGELSGGTAARLDRQARATVLQIKRHLPASTTSTATSPAAASTTSPVPAPASNPRGPGDSSKTPPAAGIGPAGTAPGPGDHGRGHGYGHRNHLFPGDNGQGHDGDAGGGGND